MTFLDTLNAWMAYLGIENRAQLVRRTGMAEQTIYSWWRTNQKGEPDSFEKLLESLNMTRAQFWAGPTQKKLGEAATENLNASLNVTPDLRFSGEPQEYEVMLRVVVAVQKVNRIE